MRDLLKADSSSWEGEAPVEPLGLPEDEKLSGSAGASPSQRPQFRINLRKNLAIIEPFTFLSHGNGMTCGG